MKAVVAMSGGVDSSVAAYLLKKQGIEVTGLSFELWDKRDLGSSNLCCSTETINLAKAVAEKLDIKHHTVDVRDAFYSHVIENFCESYINGRTPNPCILCNKYIKFDYLLKKADELGAELISTGHYARIEKSDCGKSKERCLLKKGADLKKDQSYVLYVMKQNELARTVFPIGAMKKEETRQIARELELASAMRAESQEICFIGNDSYADFIKDFSPDALRPGPVLDMDGKKIGEHKGIAFYTIGQRKGLNIASLRPHYVSHIDRIHNTITAGKREDAMKKAFKVRELNWISMDAPTAPVRAGVKIRSTARENPALIMPEDNDNVLVKFDDPQWAPAPGQSAVFYEKDTVIGGGIIA